MMRMDEGERKFDLSKRKVETQAEGVALFSLF